MTRTSGVLVLQMSWILVACGSSTTKCPDVQTCACDGGRATDSGLFDAAEVDADLQRDGGSDAGSCRVRAALLPVTLTSGTSLLCHETPDPTLLDMTVRIYQDGSLLDTRVLPCVQDSLDLQRLSPGEYEIAVSYEQYHVGLRLVDPARCPTDVPHHTEYCDPIRLTIESCDELIEMESASLFCDLGAGPCGR